MEERHRCPEEESLVPSQPRGQALDPHCREQWHWRAELPQCSDRGLLLSEASCQDGSWNKLLLEETRHRQTSREVRWSFRRVSR